VSKVITAEKAASLIKDGATVGASGLVLAGWPEEVAITIEKRFLESGEPKGFRTPLEPDQLQSDFQ
jgi:propionate CoA-transferase